MKKSPLAAWKKYQIGKNVSQLLEVQRKVMYGITRF